jgi:hypothetical protein
METLTLEERPLTVEQIIEKQRAKFERVLTQIQPGLAIEIIRYWKTSRILVARTYRGEDLEVYTAIVRRFFNDACKELRPGQNLRIQLMRG